MILQNKSLHIWADLQHFTGLCECYEIMHRYPEELREGSVSLIKILILLKRIPELPYGVPSDCSQYTPLIFPLILWRVFVGGGSGVGHLYLFTPLTMESIFFELV